MVFCLIWREVSSGTSLSDGTTYYASQTVGGCESSRDAAHCNVNNESYSDSNGYGDEWI